MIIGLHYLGERGGVLAGVAPGTLNYYSATALESLFLVGVACFVLITGYFQVTKQEASVYRVLDLLSLVLFYGVGFYALAISGGLVEFDLPGLAKATLPFLFDRHWFVETYVILYMLSPFLNVGLRSMDRRSHLTLLGVLLGFFSLWPSVLPGGPVSDSGYGIINFVVLYCIGAYFRLHGLPKVGRAWLVLGYLASAAVTFLAAVTFPEHIATFWSYNFFFNLVGAVCLFLVFSTLKLESEFINRLARCSFGVYLIHVDFSIGSWLYRTVLRVPDFWNSPFLLLHAIGSVALIYVAAAAIEFTRAALIGPLARKARTALPGIPPVSASAAD